MAEAYIRIVSVITPLLLLLVTGCGEQCKRPISSTNAVEVARKYFLGTSIAALNAGTEYERREAEKMKAAGFNETIYKDVFSRSVEVDFRKAPCNQEAATYQISESLAHGGYDVFFRYATPVDTSRNTISVGINITSCGEVGHLLGPARWRDDCK